MTPALRQFLSDWLAWAEAGAPEHEVFVRFGGLCVAAPDDTRDELYDLFNDPYPFGGSKDYWERAEHCTQHENPARLAWVRQQLGVEG